MTKEKIASLTKYMSDLNNKLKEPVPTKHIGHSETYKQFLKNEIAMVKNTLDKAIDQAQK